MFRRCVYWAMACYLLGVPVAYAKDQILSVQGTYVSSRDTGMGQDIVIKAGDGTLVPIMANYPYATDRKEPWPPPSPLKSGAHVTVVERSR